jgi:hypothetical protein
LTAEETIAELYSDPNRGIPKELEKEAKGLKQGQLSFRRVMCWCMYGRTRGLRK